MLRHTFCHLPGVGAQTEQKLWRAGFLTWEALLGPAPPGVRCPLRRSPAELLHESLQQHQRGNAAYFGDKLPPNQQWRLFADYRDCCAYLDIETTGLGGPGDHVTTVALYDGRAVHHFVHGRNLDEFPDAVARYRLLVTYNGSGFDLPFLRRQLRIPLAQAHIDLRYLWKGLGIGGGLKNVERHLGVRRPGMESIDGMVAVLLWAEYRRRRDLRALETLLAYNVQDVLNLEPLMVEAFNRKLEGTPFAAAYRAAAGARADNPFAVDEGLVRRLTGESPWLLAFGR